MDHVKKAADGGLYEEENLRPAHGKCNNERHVFHVSFEEVNALVAQYLNEEKYDRHAAGNVIAKVMSERIRRLKKSRGSTHALPKDSGGTE
jgi:hypothetical protein